MIQCNFSLLLQTVGVWGGEVVMLYCLLRHHTSVLLFYFCSVSKIYKCNDYDQTDRKSSVFSSIEFLQLISVYFTILVIHINIGLIQKSYDGFCNFIVFKIFNFIYSIHIFVFL